MAKALGKGLDIFFPEDKDSDELLQVKVKELRPNPYQPRRVFDKEAMEELKESIVQHGILQPIVARKSIKGYEIVVGERRYRAAQEAGLEEVPVIVRPLTDQQMMELAILENLQREDLTTIEEALAYQTLIEKLGLTQGELAKRLGKSRPHIANHLRLLALPADLQQMITNGKLSMGHGRALLGLKDKNKMPTLAEKTIKEELNVRQLEKLIQQLNENVPRETLKEKKSIFIQEREGSLRERFGTPVKIKQGKNKEKGKIEIEFFSTDDLNRILELLGEQEE